MNLGMINKKLFVRGGFMKSQLLLGLCSLFMLSLLTGCGKDSKNSSGSQTSLYSGTVPVNSQQAFNNLKSWYTSATEGYPNSPGTYTEYRQMKSININPNCDTKSYLGGLINFDLCYSSSSSSPSVSRNVFVVAGQAKSSNAKLAAAFTPPAGYQMINATQQMSIFMVEYGNFTTGHVLRYRIDSAVHSAFNPVEIYNTSTGQQEFLVNIR
jgi:hypothetical protein